MVATTAVTLESPPREKAPEGKLSRFFSSRGRIGVRTYITRSFFGMVPVIVAFMLVGLAVSTDESEAADTALLLSEQLVMALAAAIALVSIFYMIMMGIRRLHDLEMHGWFYLITMAPLVGGFFGLYMTFAPGKLASNKYGEPHAPSLLDKLIGGLLIALFVLGAVAFIAVMVLDLAL